MINRNFSEKDIQMIYLLLKACAEGILIDDTRADWDDPEIIESKEVGRLLNRFSGMIPPDVRKKLDFSIIAKKYGDWNRMPDPEILDGIQDAFSCRRVLEVTYFSLSSGKLTKRKVSIYAQNARYIVGYCHLAKEIRKFRKSRIVSIKHTKEKYSIPEDFNKKEFL